MQIQTQISPSRTTLSSAWISNSLMLTLPEWYVELDTKEIAVDNVVKLVKQVTGKDSDVKVIDLRGGITNRLLKAEQDGLKLLVRAFGRGTDTFIDREREFLVHQQLYDLGLASKLYCKFGNGLMYGYVPGRTTQPFELSNEKVMINVARRLAQWHASLKPETIASQMTNDIGDLWTVLDKWVELCPEGVLPMTKQEIRTEYKWLKKELAVYAGRNVFGHCDLLSANILIPQDTDLTENSSDNAKSIQVPRSESTSSIRSQTDPRTGSSIQLLSCSGSPVDVLDILPVPKLTPVSYFEDLKSDASFIDFEYAVPCPRAFDIANHFQEWQGYDCIKADVPTPSLSDHNLFFWCTEYLKAFAKLTQSPQDINELVTELQAFWGLPGFYWGIWSAIQSKSSQIDFEYADYATSRFQEYIDWKKNRYNE